MLEPESIAPETIRPLLRSEYDKLVELGAFEDQRVELLCGQLVTMSPQGGDHARITAWLAKTLIRVLDDSFEVRAHSPYAASEDSEPEPDVSVCRVWANLHDHPTDALLLIEVSDSSLRKDRKIKGGIYARNGVPEYWIVELTRSIVEVHTQPVNGRYTIVEERGAGDVLRPSGLPEIAIAIADVPWPPAGAA